MTGKDTQHITTNKVGNLHLQSERVNYVVLFTNTNGYMYCLGGLS